MWKMHSVIKYAFAALLLLGANSSYSANIWQLSGGSLWADHSCGNIETAAGQPISNCYITQTTESFVEYHFAVQWVPHNYWGFSPYVGTCDQLHESQSGYTEDSNGNCAPPSSCPSPGTATQFWSDAIVGPSNANPQVNVNGCEVTMTDMVSCSLYSNQEGAACKYNGTFTGNESSSPNLGGEEPENTVLTESNSGSTMESSQSASSDTGDVVDNGDGTTTQTNTESKTNTHNSGSEMYEDDNYIYIKSSDGTITQYDKTTTTVTNADGSKSVTTSTTGGVTIGSTDNTVIDKSTAQKSSTNTPSTTIDNSSVTTNIYDSSGQLISSTTSTSGTGTGTGTEDETVEGNCGAPGQPSCDVILSGEDNLSDPQAIIDALPSHAAIDANISDLQSGGNVDEGDLFQSPSSITSGISVLGGATTCNADFGMSEWHGETFRPFASFCGYYDSDIRPALKWFFYILTIFALYTIYIRAMRVN